MEPIRVPRPPKTAFNKNRPVSDLLKAQIAHFQHLEAKLPEERWSPYAPHEMTTESAAAQYIAHMTRVLCDAGRTELVTLLEEPQAKSSELSKTARKTRSSSRKSKSASKHEAHGKNTAPRSAKATKRVSKEKTTKSTHAKRKRTAKS